MSDTQNRGIPYSEGHRPRLIPGMEHLLRGENLSGRVSIFDKRRLYRD